MTKTLKLTFTNSEGKKTNLTLASPKEDLQPDDVRGAMKKISEAHAFENEGVVIYNSPQSAAYIERHVTSIFDDTATASSKQRQFRNTYTDQGIPGQDIYEEVELKCVNITEKRNFCQTLVKFTIH